MQGEKKDLLSAEIKTLGQRSLKLNSLWWQTKIDISSKFLLYKV